MTMRRLDRKRLFEAEKLGKTIDPSVGAGIKDALVSATQHREGHKLITDLVFDLGTSKGEIKSGTDTTDDPCGVSGTSVSNLCKVTDGVFGTVTSLEVVCLEGSSDGLMTAYNFVSGTAGDGYLGSPDTGSPGVIEDTAGSVDGKNQISTVGDHTVFAFDADDLSDKYLYICAGDNAGTKSEATATITIDSGDAANFADGSRLVLFDETGAKYEMIIDKTNLAYNATGVPFKIGLNGADTIIKAEEGFKKGIEATNSNFSVSTANSDGTITITAKSGTGADGNNASHGNDNAYIAGSGETETVTVSNFSGGTTKGKNSSNENAAFTSGKFLMRFTGFVAPDDI